jgi:hypothetical protein
MTNFSGNAGYASAVGLLVRYHLQSATHGQLSLFQNSKFWNNPLGVGLHYAQNSVLRNLTIAQRRVLGRSREEADQVASQVALHAATGGNAEHAFTAPQDNCVLVHG